VNRIDSLRALVDAPTLPRAAGDHLVVESRQPDLHSVTLTIRPTRLLLPLREGEMIDHPDRIAVGESYSLTYPGTASMKCVVVYQDDQNFFLGGKPSYEYTHIQLERLDHDTFSLQFTSREHEYLIIPFQDRWEDAADRYRSVLNLNHTQAAIAKPRFLIQLGVKDPFGVVHIDHFRDLIPIVSQMHDQLGSGHILHLFGTNTAGFDRMFPDYTVDPALGGEEALGDLLKHANSLGLTTSHHYNPRIADSDWIRENPTFRAAIVKKDGVPVEEPYKGHSHFVMDPTNEAWFDRCFETIHYLAGIGFDFLEIDQFTYQRNFYSATPLAVGYRNMVEQFNRLGYKFWLEGVSDIFRLSGDNFYQILIRDRAQLWEDGENRRGYPYGRTFSDFFMYLWPDSNVSYQVFTENKSFDHVPERLKQARSSNATILDLELGFYDSEYESNLKRLLAILRDPPE